MTFENFMHEQKGLLPGINFLYFTIVGRMKNMSRSMTGFGVMNVMPYILDCPTNKKVRICRRSRGLSST